MIYQSVFLILCYAILLLPIAETHGILYDSSPLNNRKKQRLVEKSKEFSDNFLSTETFLSSNNIEQPRVAPSSPTTCDLSPIFDEDFAHLCLLKVSEINKDHDSTHKSFASLLEDISETDFLLYMLGHQRLFLIELLYRNITPSASFINEMFRASKNSIVYELFTLSPLHYRLKLYAKVCALGDSLTYAKMVQYTPPGFVILSSDIIWTGKLLLSFKLGRISLSDSHKNVDNLRVTQLMVQLAFYSEEQDFIDSVLEELIQFTELKNLLFNYPLEFLSLKWLIKFYAKGWLPFISFAKNAVMKKLPATREIRFIISRLIPKENFYEMLIECKAQDRIDIAILLMESFLDWEDRHGDSYLKFIPKGEFSKFKDEIHHWIIAEFQAGCNMLPPHLKDIHFCVLFYSAVPPPPILASLKFMLAEKFLSLVTTPKMIQYFLNVVGHEMAIQIIQAGLLDHGIKGFMMLNALTHKQLLGESSTDGISIKNMQMIETLKDRLASNNDTMRKYYVACILKHFYLDLILVIRKATDLPKVEGFLSILVEKKYNIQHFLESFKSGIGKVQENLNVWFPTEYRHLIFDAIQLILTWLESLEKAWMSMLNQREGGILQKCLEMDEEIINCLLKMTD